jgi:cytochrome P450
MKTAVNIPQVPRLYSFTRSFRFVHHPLEVLGYYVENYGPTFNWYIAGMQKCMLSTDPGFIQHVLQKNHRNYNKSPLQSEKLAHFLGLNLLTSNGDYWLRQRRLIQPGFHRQRLAGLLSIMQEVVDETLSELDRQIAREPEIDIFPRMNDMAFRIVARSLFSANLSGEELEQLKFSITMLQEFLIRNIRQPYLAPWFKISGKKRYHERLSAETDKVILNIIRRRRASAEQPDDLLQMLLDARYEDTGEPMTDRQLIAESAVLFTAGHETSANALTWTWYLLAQHPEVVQKLRDEAFSVCSDGPVSFEQWPQLSYSRQVIEESMRLFPPAWITDRTAIADDEYQGIPIPAGTMIVPYIYGAHHDAKYWEAPEVFNPARFAPEKRKEQVPFSYLPFGGGPRLCIGNNFAMMEMQLILTDMIRRYNFELVPEHPVEAEALVTLRPRHGVRLRVKRL